MPPGMRKGRGVSGLVQRRIKTPRQTMKKANNVPMLHRKANFSMGVKAAQAATAAPQAKVVKWGV